MTDLLKRSAAVILALAVILVMMPVMTGKAHASETFYIDCIDILSDWNFSNTIEEGSAPSASQMNIRLSEDDSALADNADHINKTNMEYGWYDKSTGNQVTSFVAGKTYNYKVFLTTNTYTAEFASAKGRSYSYTVNDEPGWTVRNTNWENNTNSDEFYLILISPDCKVTADDPGTGGDDPYSGGGTPPSWDAGSVKFVSTTPGTVTITATSFNYISIEVRRAGEVILNDYLGYYGDKSVTVTIPYVGQTAFTYRFYTTEGTTEWKTAHATSSKLAKPTLSVTKIAAGSAGLSWSSVAGATGYKVYKGKKVIKTLGAGKTKFVYKKAKAGSAKYSVSAIIKSAGNTYEGPKSAARKGKGNFRTYSGSKDYNSVKYGIAPYSITKIELKGSTYTITGYVLNNRMFKMLKYKKLEITLYCDGKKVAHKKWKNLKVNCKDYASKKLVLKIKGKGGKDFRNATGTTYHAEWTPYWQSVGDKAF